MKKTRIVLSLFIGLVAFNLQAQQEKETVTAPVVEFKQKSFDFGTINEGKKVEFDYEFTNTGLTDLIITKIKGSCGCTVPSNWKKEPIKPGETSSFHVVFNSKNKPNKQHKSVYMSCNTAKGRETVSFKGTVIPDLAMAKVREERMAKRKADVAKRKAARLKQNNAKKNTALMNAKISQDVKSEAVLLAEKRALTKMRSKTEKVIDRKVRKSEKELKREAKLREEKLSIAKKEQKIKERQLKADAEKLKSEEKAANRKLKVENEAVKRSEKERKRVEKEAKRKLKEERAILKRTEKAAKKVEKEHKETEKAAKKKEKLQEKVNKAIDKVEKEENRLAKLEGKLKRLEMKGKVSAADILKRKLKIEKQKEKINDAKLKLSKAKRKL